MLKLFAYILCIVFATNLVAPQFVFWLQENQALTVIEKQIDAKLYNPADVVLVEIPLNMPYHSDKEEIEAYGETVIKGKHYRFIKQKIVNNVLQLFCLPNLTKDNIAKLKKDFSKQEKQPTPVEKHKSVKVFSVDYMQAPFDFNLAATMVMAKLKYNAYSQSIVSATVPTPQRPPCIS